MRRWCVRDRVGTTALVLERTAARAGGVAADRGGSGFAWVFHFGQAEILVESFDSRLEEDRGALRFDEFGDLDGGFQADRGGGVLVAEDLSKSVDGEVGQVAEFVEHLVGTLLAEGEESAGEIGEGTGPEVAWLEFEGGAVDTGFPGSSGNGEACDEAFEHLDLNRRQGVELC